MVAVQNKCKPAQVQHHVSEPDGMIDIDLKTHIDNVIEINKKKLYKKQSCFKQLAFVIPAGILVTTFALLLLRTYLNDKLNTQISIEHETIPTLEYSNTDFRENVDEFSKLKFDNVRENVNNKIQIKVKRNLQQSNAADSFIPLKSTPENLNYEKTTLPSSNEINASSTPSFLYFLSFYKGNHLKTTNGLPNRDAKNLNKTITPIKSFAEESFNSTGFKETSPSKLISSTEEMDLQITTNTLERVTLANPTSKSDKMDLHSDDHEIETSSVTITESESTLDSSTEQLPKYTHTSELDLEPFSDDTAAQTLTPKSDQTALDQSKFQQSFSENNKAEIEVPWPHLYEMVTVEPNEFNRHFQDTKNLAKTVSSTTANELNKPNFNFDSTKYVLNFDKTDSTSNLSADKVSTEINQLFKEGNSTNFEENSSGELISGTEKNHFDQFTTDNALEEVTFSNTESIVQFSTFKSDKIILPSDDLKIETSSASVPNIPEQNEFSTEEFSTKYTESPHNFGLNNIETPETWLLNNENFTIGPTDSNTKSEISKITTSFPDTSTHVQARTPKADAIDSNISYQQTSHWNENSKTKIYEPLKYSTESTIGVEKNLSLVNVLKKLKFKLTTPLKYKNTTHFLTTKSDLDHSNQNLEISTLVNAADLNESITDIDQENDTLSKETDLYDSMDQENFNNVIEISTKFSHEIEKSETESSTKNMPTSFAVNARWNTISPYTESYETESIFDTDDTFDTNKENIEDKNETSFKFNGTNRNAQLSKTISKDFHEFLRKNRRATAMNQQVFSNKNNNKNNQFHLKTISNNNWQDQDFQKNQFEDDTNTAQENTSPNQQMQTNNQNPTPNQNYPMTVCPSGIKILQQSNAYPYSYNVPSLYQNILPLSSVPNNPYMNPAYPYPGVGNISPFYNNNPAFQPAGFYPNNFYGSNSLSNGQYYVCSSLSNPYISTVPEVRKRNEFILQKSNSLDDLKNGTRMVAECPFGEYRCNDGSKCIKRNQYCDNAVNCNDMSDELECSCISRIEKSRVCDGYLDCPDGEDESKCFGCDEDSFNCDDWTPQDRFSTCIPLDQRCNGVVNCPNAKDEERCSILTEYFSTEQNFLVTYAKGYLYRNFGGKWYPVCRNPEVWANEACQLDGGGNYMSPLTHLIQTNVNYIEPYVSMSPKGQLHFDNTCDKNLAVFVECALLVCGTRLKTRNYYRREEVDTSAEQIVGQSLNSHKNVMNLTDSVENPILGHSRVVGGKPSQPESWPWVVSIYRNGVFHCGGALINEYWIATAAHCVDKYWHYYFEVQAGVLRRYSYSPVVQSRVAAHIIPHQSYDKMKLKNDIALINLDNPVRYNRYIRPICLPSEITAGQNFMRNPPPNTICSAIGWGATAEHGSDPDHLREVDVPVLKSCKYKEDREGHEICAGLREGGKDACQGDSGGPFLCENPNVANQWYLAGIVSHGEGCARPNEPGVYTRVSMYLEWIRENIRSQVPQRMQPLNHCPGYTCKDTKRCIPKQRHCDKIVDCLYADDEIDCDRSHFNEIFKHAIMDNLLPRTGQDTSPNNQDDNQNENDNDEPDYILRQPQTSDTSSELFETIAANNFPIENTLKNNRNFPFLCQKMLQTIDVSKRCDKVHDCEDATDEENCTCVDYVKYSHPEAVCDGVIDCFDASDEKNCTPKCGSNEFYCYLSNACIQSYKQCDGKENCPIGEDERNCFALTDLKSTIELGMDSRPILNKDGFVSFYKNGTWQIVCGNWNTTEGAQFATQICIYLGYHDYKAYYKLSVPKTSSNLIQNGIYSTPREAKDPNNRCLALKVVCSDTIDVTHEENIITKQSFDHFEFIPWNAEIYVDGKYQCSGALLTKEWVVTSKTCFGKNLQLYKNYMAVLLGGRSKIYLNVRNIYEQVIRVVEYNFVSISDIALLRLEKEVTVSSYVRPLGLDVKQYNVNEKQVCVVVGRNSSNQTELLYLKSIDTCTGSGFRCFTKDPKFNNSSCKDEDFNFWGGCVVCRSARGWYPASVFFNHFGPCLKKTEMWSSIQYWKPNILDKLEQTPFIVGPPPCKGFRCTLGECIENHKVCDGIPHCRDGKDEELNYCVRKMQNCTATQSCECKPSDLKCKNGKCVEKFRFCDKVNDCGDWSDEPAKCDCKSYLAVTDPKKICDGVRNCRDRSDEDPFICECTENKFRCKQSRLCVSQEVVCDQISDCPNGEDESHCIELAGSSEVQIRTAGLWHAGCFAEHLTTLQLEDICEHLGYIGTSADRNETVKKISGRPVMDPFIGIVVNQIDDQALVIAKREGDKPFITFEEDYNCYRLFLNCL